MQDADVPSPIIPPQFVGMSPEAVDIAWTIPQYADEAKNTAEQKHKEAALVEMRKVRSEQQTVVKEESPSELPSGIEPTPDPRQYEAFLSQSNVIATTNKITELLRSATCTQEAASREIYNLLTKRSWLQTERENRGTESLEWLMHEYKPHREWYRDAISKIEYTCRQSGMGTASNPAWFSITASERQTGREVDTKYKAYDTLDITDYGKIAELPQLAADLAQLGKETGDSIKIKIPGNFSGFITHNDSIVIHCDNRTTCERALVTVAHWKAQHDIKAVTRELNRATIALDGKTTEDGEINSFSQLVSEHIAHWLTTHAANYQAETLAQEAVKYAIAFAQKEPTIHTR